MFVSIGGGGDDCCGSETDKYEECASDAGVCLGKAVWLENLVEEGGYTVEEADVDAEWEEDQPKFRGTGKFEEAPREGDAADVEGGAGRCRRQRGDEE